MPAWTVRTQTVRTLAAIGEQCAQDRPIHFLKVDVERHEEIVLRGMDFSRWRPWIILIETLWARDQTWETLVTGAGYQAILFDGINTYYLAEEHLALKPAFDIPRATSTASNSAKATNSATPSTKPTANSAPPSNGLNRPKPNSTPCKIATSGEP